MSKLPFDQNTPLNQLPHYRPCELDGRLVGSLALAPFMRHTTASRLQMLGSQLPQALPIVGAQTTALVTGYEQVYGEGTHCIKLEYDAKVKRVLRRMGRREDSNPGYQTPLVTLVVENLSKSPPELDIIEIPQHFSLHPNFGFPYRLKNPGAWMRPDAIIPRGTILAYPPNVTDDNILQLTAELQTALITDAYGIEDGCRISESAAKRLRFPMYGQVTMSFGKTRYPLNVHGKSPEEFLIVPEIGSLIPENGVVMASRDYDPVSMALDMTPEALRTVVATDNIYHGEPNARVVDVVVLRGNCNDTIVPEGTDAQIRELWSATQLYHTQLIDTYMEMQRQYGKPPQISPQLQERLVASYAITDPQRNENNSKLKQQYRGKTMDNWMVTVHYEYYVTPTLGYKMSDFSAFKGVVVAVVPDEEMPVDVSGNRAEFTMSPYAIPNRQATSRPLEQFINASRRMTHLRFKEMLGDERQGAWSPEAIEKAWNYLLGFYTILSPLMLPDLNAPDFDRIRHLRMVYEHGITLYTPTDNPVDYLKACRYLREHYPPPYDVVTWMEKGVKKTSKRPVLIGGINHMLLEKIGKHWAAVGSSRCQIFGTPARSLTSDSRQDAIRRKPTRTNGESEIRHEIMVTNNPDELVRVYDQTNNPATHRQVVNTILRSQNPMQIEDAAPNAPRRQGRVTTMILHTLACSGLNPVVEETPK